MDARLKTLFDTAMMCVDESCGDGDGVIIFKGTDIQMVAKAFEEWQTQHTIRSKWPLKRHDFGLEHVLFTDESNENLTLISKRETDNNPFYDWLDIKMEVN